jgi:hypothetical protein
MQYDERSGADEKRAPLHPDELKHERNAGKGEPGSPPDKEEDGTGDAIEHGDKREGPTYETKC